MTISELELSIEQANRIIAREAETQRSAKGGG